MAEIRNIATEMKDAFHSLVSRFNRRSQDRSIDISQLGMQREKRTGKLSEQKLQELSDNFKRCNTDAIGKAEEEKESLKESGEREV